MSGVLHSETFEVTANFTGIVSCIEDYRLVRLGVHVSLEHNSLGSRDSSEPKLIRDQLPIDGNLIVIIRQGNGDGESYRFRSPMQRETRQ